jgi:hypothetical protein
VAVDGEPDAALLHARHSAIHPHAGQFHMQIDAVCN